MTEIAKIFETAGVGIGLLVILIFGFIAVIVYLAKQTNETAKYLKEKDIGIAGQLKIKDIERADERERFEVRLEALMAKSNDAYLQVSKSNENIAKALYCIQTLVDESSKQLINHDNRAIKIDEKVTDIKYKVEDLYDCNKRKGG